MSYSTLLNIESCPRRWALGSARYPHIWERAGYPKQINLAALEGLVVHQSLQDITSALVARGCVSLSHEDAVATLRDLGGYTQIILRCLDQVLQHHEENPRVAPVLENIRRKLQSKVGEARTKLQSLISRIQLESQYKVPRKRLKDSHGAYRGKLPFGSHREIELRAQALSWLGIVDLLTFTESVCEIRDFKTGEAKDEHEFQLNLYALLWAREQDLNPDARLASKLVLSYSDVDLEVPPMDEEELEGFESLLCERTSSALAELAVKPPRASPGPEVCQFCHVRQLCDDYWRSLDRTSSSALSPEDGFKDIQTEIVRDNCDGTWHGIVEIGLGLDAGASILIRSSKYPACLREGQHVRLLNVHVTFPEDDPLSDKASASRVVATLGATSEVFFFPESAR